MIECFIDKPLIDWIVIDEYCLESPAEASVYFSLSFVHSGAGDLSCLNDMELWIIDWSNIVSLTDWILNFAHLSCLTMVKV